MTQPTSHPSTPPRAVPLVVPPTDSRPEVYPSSGGAPVDPAATTTFAQLPAAPAAYHRVPPRDERRKHRTPLAWLPWAALAALLVLALLAWAIGAATGDSTDSAAGRTGGTTTASSLTAGGADITSGGAALRGHVGEAAVGRRAVVQSVVSDEGFWVGSNAADRVFVHLSASSRSGQAESPFQVRAGQHIDLTGTMRALGKDTFGVTTSEGLGQLRSEGAFVDASSVHLSS